MNFIKTFLAAILAFVVGSVLVVFLWIFILLGIAGSMEKSVAVHPESILKLDFSEVLTDACLWMNLLILRNKQFVIFLWPICTVPCRS